MLLLQDVLNQISHPWYLSHIPLYIKLPEILPKGDEKTDAIITTVCIDLLEQVRMLPQQFHLSPQKLHKFLPKLNYQFTNSNTCPGLVQPVAPLNPLCTLQMVVVNLHGGLLSNIIWQMDVTHHVLFGYLRYVYDVIDIFSGFTYAL